MHKAYLASVIRNGTWINRGWQLPYQQEVTEGQDSLGECTLLLGLSRTAELKRVEGSVGGNGREKTHRRCTISLDYVLGKGSRWNGFVSHYGGHCYLFLAVLDLCKESACNAGDIGSIPELRGSPGEGNANPLQYSCPGKPLGQRSLVGYSPWGHKESTRLSDWHAHIRGHKRKLSGRGSIGTGPPRTCALLTEKGTVTRQRALWGSGGGRGEMCTITRQPEGCPLPVPCSEFSHRGNSKGREVPGTRPATAL